MASHPERGGGGKRGVGKGGEEAGGEEGGWVAVPPVALTNAVETVIGPGYIRH